MCLLMGDSNYCGVSVSLKMLPCLFFPQNTDPEEEVVEGVPVAILTVYEDDGATSPPTVIEIDVVLEGTVIQHNLPDLAAAFTYLFGLMYAMDISYPEKMRYTFEAIQTIFFELGSTCSQGTHSLKDKLLL